MDSDLSDPYQRPINILVHSNLADWIGVGESWTYDTTLTSFGSSMGHGETNVSSDVSGSGSEAEAGSMKSGAWR